MSKVLTTEQREQAGSDSYNRFEYQVHWIVCHIIGRLQEDAECIVFCEFHDDMAEFSPSNQQYQFFQIKTKEDSSDWTIAEMSKREKKKTGGYKKSFLGFIFYNYLVFGSECSHCHFVSNNDFDNDVLLWQTYVEDGKNLQTENIELYEKIKDRIKEEFSDDMPSNFDSVFEEFIQNTFVHKSELQLSYSSFYKNKGQYEIYESCKAQLEVLQRDIDSYVAKIAIIDDKINEKKSKERSKEIRGDIEGYCRTFADAINLPKTFIKLRDFVQIIDRTGSETPRLVYMYQSALYLYNLYRAKSPFNFYVVDTPNQQGQDAENLGSIFKSLELFLSDDGQVIVGTERETGMEQKANNVIRLTDKRRCLNDANYAEHLELLEKLQKCAIHWISDNHKKLKQGSNE